VTDFRNAVEARKDLLDAYARHEMVSQRKTFLRLENAAQQAGVAIFERGQKEPRSGAWAPPCQRSCCWASAPSSPMSATAGSTWSPEQTVQLTEDHSLVNELIRHGKVTRESLALRLRLVQERRHACAGSLRDTQIDTIDLEVLPATSS